MKDYRIQKHQNKAMKRKLFAAFLLLGALQGNAQKFSLNIDAGYGFNIAPAAIGEGNGISLSAWQAELQNVIYSYGRGWNGNAELEYFPGKHFGFGLGIGYLKSAPVKTAFDSPSSLLNEEATATMLRFSPFVKMKLDFGDWSIFSRWGYLLGAAGKIDRTRSLMNPADVEFFNRRVYNQGLSQGATAGLGAAYRLSPRFSLSAEARLFVHSFGPRKSELVASESNGKDSLHEFLPGQIHTNYVDRYVHEWNPNGSTDYAEPTTELRRFYPFSSLGLNLGVQYKL